MKASTGAFFTVVAILIFVIVLATAVRTILLDFNVEDPSAESALETQEEIRKQLQKEKSDQERLMRDIKNQQRSAESRNRSN